MIYPIILGGLAVTFATGAYRLARMFGENHASSVRRWGPADALGLGAAVTAALFAIHPYLTGNLVGSGDSYHYGLQVADFVTQVRRGVMPVLAGQSEYAFNGFVHNVRTAPYLVHLAGLLDALTLRRLSFVQLQDLTVVVSALASAVAAYLVARRLSAGRRLAAALLAILYVTSPAILAPLVLSDMFATYMTAPWLLLCWYGMAEMFRRTDDTGPQLLCAVALAMLWYAHPPVAAWMSVAWACAQLGRFMLSAGAAGQWRRQLLAGTLVAGLTAFLFVSVAKLHLSPATAPPPEFYAYAAGDLSRAVQSAFVPFRAGANGGADIQLGWALWGVLFSAVGLLLRRRRIEGMFLGTLCLLFLLLLIPAWPWVSSKLWLLVPDRLALLSNWPQQRLCPILAAATVVAGAAAFDPRNWRRTWAYPVACGVLLLGCGWSLGETARIHQRTANAFVGATTAGARFAPGNLVLTRSSYDELNRASPYYTDGWTDPEFESRLLGPEMETAQENAATILASAPAVSAAAPLVPLAPQAVLHLAGPGNYLLVFAFEHPSPVGEITVRSAGVDRIYSLPFGGGPLAFGSEPGCAKTTPLRLAAPGEHQIVVTATIPGVSVRAAPFTENQLPIRLTAQTPYTAAVRAFAGGYLETPRVHFDGYEAAVNGHPVAVRRSPNGLVAVPVPAGDSIVVLTYVGSRILSASWLFSLTLSAGLPWLAWGLFRSRPRRIGPAEIDRSWIRQHNLLTALDRVPRRRLCLLSAIAGVVAILGCIGSALHRREVERKAFGSLRLTLEIPRWAQPQAEPLVVIGRTGAADCIYVIHESPNEIRLGLDHWSVGGPVSAPIRINYGHSHVLELTIGGLYPRPGRTNPKLAALFGDPRAAPFVLKLDGRTIFDTSLPFYEARAAEVAVGRNTVGSSVCGACFTGRILSIERFLPTFTTPPPTSGQKLTGGGSLGEYIGRIYEEVWGWPRLIVDRAEGFRS